MCWVHRIYTTIWVYKSYKLHFYLFVGSDVYTTVIYSVVYTEKFLDMEITIINLISLQLQYQIVCNNVCKEQRQNKFMVTLLLLINII